MIANFKVLEVLKSCNKASFVRACDDQGKTVLVKYNKKISSNRYMSDGLRSEYELIKSIDQSKVLTLQSFITQDYHSAIIYEDGDGELLSDRLKKLTTFSHKLRIAILISEAIHYLHTNDLLHRNISPNAFWVEQNDSGLLIIDLSLAIKLKQGDLPSINSNLIGKAAYISPEQTGRSNLPTDNRSDLYSLGATLYEVFSGQQIYAEGEQDQLSIVYKQLTQKVTPLSAIDNSIAPKISEVVARLLEKSPNSRYQSSFGLLQDLKRIEKEWLENHQISDFKIASEDSPETLQVSNNLYGREKQIAQLMAQFNQVVAGQNKIVLVSGCSGVGKSALIKEVEKPISKKKSLFATGKCDQFSTDQPFYVFSQALRLLLRQILNLPNDEKTKWKRAFQTQLGENFSLLIELIPELQAFSDNNITTLKELSTLANDHRFMMTFVQFINTLASKERPLVIVLDDLQWADIASLTLIKELLDQNSHLMLIGTYRDNEIDQTHLLAKMIRDLTAQKQCLTEIYLNPLGLHDIKRLLADSLWLTLDTIEPLAIVCIDKTQGNPFYLNQFIKMLNEEGLIVYSYKKGAWQWDQSAIEMVNVTSNVVDLMLKKLQKFSEENLKILKLAANLGNRFSLGDLQKVACLSLKELYKRLWPMIADGYILPENQSHKFISSEDILSQASFIFLHDKVQQAAFQLIPEDDVAQFKWQFGVRLLRGTLKEDLEGRIFEIIEQLNAGKKHASVDEKKVLIDLNLLAAEKAKRSSAFTYAQKNMLNVVLFAETLRYRRLEVFNTLAQVSYLIGDFERAEALYVKAMSAADTALEIVSVIAIQTAQYQIQGRFSESLVLQKEGLCVLGIQIPDNDKEIEAQFMKGFKSIDTFILTNSIDGLIDHYSMEGDQQKAAMKLLMGMWYASYLSGKTPLNLLSTIIMTQLSLEHGHDDISSFAYVNYSLAIISVYSRYKEADRFGLLAVNLADIRNNKLIKASTYFLYATFTQHWNHSLQKTLPYLNISYDLALQSGDLATLGYICAVRGSDTLALGEKLQSAHTTLTDDVQLLSKHKQLDMKDCVTVGALQPVRALLGLTDGADSFDDDNFRENSFLKNYENAPLHLAYFYNAKLRHAYLVNAPKKTQLSLLDKVDIISASVPGQNKIPESTFFAALIALRFAKTASDPLFTFSEGKLRMFEQWSEVCPHNYLHKYLLLKAELARVSGDDAQIIDLYSNAIEEASNSGFNNVLAIANECFADYWYYKDKQVLAKTFITASYHEYRQWGAVAKLQQLREFWSKVNFIDDHSFGKAYKPQDAINLQTVQDINHLISSEIHLDSLLEKLMLILLKNAGAVWGALIQTSNSSKELWLEAAGDKKHIGVLLHQSLAATVTKREIPESIIRHVINTKQLCIINRPFEHAEFSHDVYFQNRSPLTIAGLPVVHQGNMIAVVYLENDLIENAFSQEHISLLNVIASQAAISLSHAFLYKNLEKRVVARTEALAAAKLKAEESTIAKSNFLANMSHEIRTPMNAVIGLNRLFKKTSLSVEQQDYADKISDASESLLGLINNILDFSKIEAKKLSLESIEFSLENVLQKISAICGQKIQEKGLEFVLEIDSNVPPLLIGDPLRLQQVLINLIDNAVKFTDAGSIKLIICSSPVMNNKYDLIFDITDTGIGIGQEEQKRLFTSFYQIDASITRKYGGTGLGLVISRELIHLMGGDLQVTSIKNKGSCFSFNVPFASGTQDSHLKLIALSEEIKVPNLSNYRLLLVEDNKINQQVAKGILAETMVNVTIAESGSEALIRIEQEKFDCVLMDIQMPVMDGITATQKIRQTFTKQQLPIIAMTAHALQSDSQLSFTAGMNAHITKPIDTNVLYQALADLLGIEENLVNESISVVYDIQDLEKNILGKLYRIEQLDVEKAIDRLQNKVSLYLSLVESFWLKNKYLPADIERYLEKNEHEKLFLIAHSLKSSAQYVGANRLAEYALVLQESTKHKKIIYNQVSDLLRELAPIINQLSPLFVKKENKGVDKPLNLTSAILLITELRFLLVRAEAASEKISWSLNALAENTIYEAQMRHLHNLICDFEFESAIIELDNLERLLTGRENG
ncbi:MAG: AAA family ATPase [Oceanospirillaceae bacterium]